MNRAAAHEQTERISEEGYSGKDLRGKRGCKEVASKEEIVGVKVTFL